MKIKTKLAILDYLKSHNDGTDEAKELIRTMKDESCFADCDSYTVSREDLTGLSKSAKRKLEQVFGKPVGKFDVNDFQRIAEALDDMIAEEYSENLYNAIECEL